MRVLLDECLPRKLKRDLPGHDVATVPEMGWSGVKNGSLIKLAAPQFDVFVTADQNLPFQQNLIYQQIALIVLVAVDNRLETLRPLAPQLLSILDTLRPGDLVRIGS